jgi:outer membrane cobalamin receptor
VYARGANLLGQRYQDVYSYRTEPRAVYAGVRLSR